MKYRFTYNLGKYKSFIQMVVKTILKELAIYGLTLALVIFANYQEGDPLFKVISNLCAFLFVVFLPKIISYFRKRKYLAYELFFDEKSLTITYAKYFVINKSISIPYSDLSFSVKTFTYAGYFPDETCIRIYSNHKFVLFLRSGGWYQEIIIEIIKVLLDVTNNTLEVPLNKRKLFKKKYLYTMELKESGVAKQLIAISKKMNK